MNEPMSTADWCEKIEGVQDGTVSAADNNPSPDELATELARNADAWICLPSSVLQCVYGIWYNVSARPQGVARLQVSAPSAAECAFVLSGEIAESETSSLHLWRDHGVLRWTRISDEGGEEALVLKDAFISTEPNLKLNYKTFWIRGAPQDNGVRPWKPYVSRFTGWGPL